MRKEIPGLIDSLLPGEQINIWIGVNSKITVVRAFLKADAKYAYTKAPDQKYTQAWYRHSIAGRVLTRTVRLYTELS